MFLLLKMFDLKCFYLFFLLIKNVFIVKNVWFKMFLLVFFYLLKMFLLLKMFDLKWFEMFLLLKMFDVIVKKVLLKMLKMFLLLKIIIFTY